ncbi:MAG: hypothetical protein AAFZ01_02220 [Pseudomonadota bacterium]
MLDPTPQTLIIPFTRRGRWRWWAMIVIGGIFTSYALAVLTSPAWSRSEIFGNSLWLVWLRGQIYLVFGALQLAIGIGYLRLTSRPAEAITFDDKGVAARRIFGWHRLPWHRIEEIKHGRRSLMIAATPITWLKIMFQDPRLLRLDASLTDASLSHLEETVRAGRQRALHLRQD